MNLPGDNFDRLIELSETPAEASIRLATNVKRLTDMTAAETIARIIKKCSIGQEIWWDMFPSVMQVARVDTNGKPQPYTQPAISIILGMRGALLGPAHDVWFILSVDPKPDEPQLERGVMQALEHLNQQKAAQVNGGPFGQRQIRDSPQA
jgi:hypothetical protein